jgi:Homeodomain-like domain
MVLSAEEHAQVSALAASRALPHALVARAKLVLWAAQGESNSMIAERLGWSLRTVGKWRRRFVEQRISGLHAELRPGRPRTYADEQGGGIDQSSAAQPASKRYALERTLGGVNDRSNSPLWVI